MRRAGDRDRLHRDERGLRRRLEGRLRPRAGRRCAPGRRGRTSTRSSRASRRATRSPDADRRELAARAREHALALRRRPRARGALAAGARRDRAAARRPRGRSRIAAEGRMSKPLVVIPNYMSEESDMEILGECVQSIRQTVSNTVDILIVDDCSPEPWLVDVFESATSATTSSCPQARERGLLAHRQRRPRAGARRGARGDPDERRHRHAHAGLARRAAARRPRSPGVTAGLVGALLLYPNGLIQHAGLYFSRIANMFEHRFRCAPGQPARGAA